MIRGWARGGGGGVSARVHQLQCCVSRVTQQIFRFSRFSKIGVVKNVKNVTLVPFCITEYFDYILAS